MAKRRTAQAIAVALVVAIGTVGCTAAASTTSSAQGPVSVSRSTAIAKEKGYAWELSVLKDGIITPREYEEAYDRYMDCQRKLGYVFDKPKYLDPVEGQRWEALSIYRGPGKPPMKAAAVCDERIQLIENPYVLAAPKVMAPQLLAKFRACLTTKGIKYTGREVNFNDFTSKLSDADYKSSTSPYTSCLLKSAHALYPNLIAVGYGR